MGEMEDGNEGLDDGGRRGDELSVSWPSELRAHHPQAK